MNRQARRIEKAIDELIKICDDGKATEEIHHILDRLREQISFYYSES
jgi:hypothetical protein